MGAPIQGKGNRRGNANVGQRNGIGKLRQPPRRPLNAAMMRHRAPFPPMMRPMMGPPNLRPPPPRGIRPPPPRLPRGPLMPPRMMGPGPRLPPPPGLRPPPPGMRPPPPHMMGMPPVPPPMRGMGFRRGGPPRRMGVQKGRVMKKRRMVGREMDLSKQWVTDAIKQEFKRKEELLAAAKSSENKEAWATYRTQREKCSQMYQAAEMEFIGQQEGNEQTREPVEEEYEESALFCDVCEQDFYSQQSFQTHISEHRVCGLDGCQYTAHQKLIEKHIQTQHITGLYEKIKSVNTPEEISKWLEERRVRYPTKENVQRRYEKQEEMLKRGEKIGERKNRFGKDKTRLSRVRHKKHITKKKVPRVKEERPKESLINEKCDWNGTMFPFRGTKDLYNKEEEKPLSDYDDDEWSIEPNKKPTVELNNALGALMGAYMSDEEQDDDTPTEEKIQRQQTEYPIEETKEKVTRPNKRKSCSGKKQIDDKLQSGFNRMKFFKRRVTLLEKLLDSEIRHERNVLLQCVQYVVSNNFFRNE